MGASAKAVDFSSVKDGGQFSPKRVLAGDYAAKIVKVEDNESKKTGNFQYLFTIKLEKYSQNSYPYYCQLTENQLWKLRNLLIAAGLNVPKKRMKLDPNKVVGKRIGVTMEDDEYEGKSKSVIAAVFPASELSGEEVDDEESDADDAEDTEDEAPEETEEKPKKKDKKGKKKKSSEENVEELDISDL